MIDEHKVDYDFEIFDILVISHMAKITTSSLYQWYFKYSVNFMLLCTLILVVSYINSKSTPQDYNTGTFKNFRVPISHYAGYILA